MDKTEVLKILAESKQYRFDLQYTYLMDEGFITLTEIRNISNLNYADNQALFDYSHNQDYFNCRIKFA